MGLQLRHKHVKCQVHLYSVDIDHHKLGYRVLMRSARSCLQWTKKTYGKFGRRPWVSFDGPTFQTPRDGTVRRPRPHRPGASESSRRKFPQQLPWPRDVDQWVFGFGASFTMSTLVIVVNEWIKHLPFEILKTARFSEAFWHCWWPVDLVFVAFSFWHFNAGSVGAALCSGDRTLLFPRERRWFVSSEIRGAVPFSVAIRDLLLPFKIPVGKKKSMIWISNEKPTTFWW